MSSPRIAITTYGRDASGEFHLPGAYVDAVRRAGGVPALLTPGETDLDPWLEWADGWLLSGGGDLSPELYGAAEHETLYGLDDERDKSELEVVYRLLKAEPPTLFVCRGAQLLNVALGGDLVVHLPEEPREGVVHRLPPRETVVHAVEAEADSRLAAVVAESHFDVVSWHHQALDNLGAGLRVTARAADGVIEAVELDGHPWMLAVQWHPELSAAEDPLQQRLFDALVEAARNRRSHP